MQKKTEKPELSGLPFFCRLRAATAFLRLYEITARVTFLRSEGVQPSAALSVAAAEKCIQLKDLNELLECKKLLLLADFFEEHFLCFIGCLIEFHLHSSFLFRYGFIILDFEKKSSDFAQIIMLIFVHISQRIKFPKLFSLNRIRKRMIFVLYLLHKCVCLFLLKTNKERRFSQLVHKKVC